MGIDVLLAILCGFVVGRVLDDVMGGSKKSEEVEEGDTDQAAGAVATEGAPPEPQAAETGEEVAAEDTVVTPKVPPEKAGEPDLQQVILDVLSASGDAMKLAEIARQIGKEHYAPLIGPMRSLLKMGRVVKQDKMYLLA